MSFDNKIATSSTDVYTNIDCGKYTVDIFVEWASGIQTPETPGKFDVSADQIVTFPKSISSISASDAGIFRLFYKVKLEDYPT